jgi:metallophosphoesterase (TIGR00282 family)
MKIGFIGDIVGKPGRKLVAYHLEKIRKKESLDLIIANYENASHGFGITQKNAKELFDAGIDIMTGGNHTWDKKEIYSFIDKMPLLRPLNYPKEVPGKGVEILNARNESIAIISLMGYYTMPMVENPFLKIRDLLKTLNAKNILIDFHAEATSEKRAMFLYLKGKVSAVLGTHTHIGTDDLTIQDNTAYITDIGLTGCRDNIIGMEHKEALNKFLTGLPVRYDIPNSCKGILQMVILEINDGKCANAYKIKAYDKDEYFVSQSAFLEK